MRKLFCLFGLLVLSASSYAVQGWMWFNNVPWVYSHEDQNWVYVATEIEVSLYDSGKWSKQDDSYLSNLGWVWMNRFPWCYSDKEKRWIYITKPSSSVKDVVVIELKDGPVVIETFRDAAPNHVERIEKLASTGQYDGVAFHRVIDGFMAQTGDVKHGKIDNFQDSLVGTGGSELPDLNSEFNDIKHVRGTCSMARTIDPHSANSQFFICFEPAPFLDNQYTVWGQVIEGMEYVDQIKVGDDIENGKVAYPDHMLKVTVEKYAPIHVYGIWNNEWSELESYKHDWDKQYAKWILDPEPYGGLEVLQRIKEAKDSGTTELYLSDNNITDLTPLAGLSNLKWLFLSGNNITDLAPLSGLTNLRELTLDENTITDLSPLLDLTNLTLLDLHSNSISDLLPLAFLENLRTLYLHQNDISDLSHLKELKELGFLDLSGNPITTSQITMLREALPNTLVSYPDDLLLAVGVKPVDVKPLVYDLLYYINEAKEAESTELSLMASYWNTTYILLPLDLSPLAELSSFTSITIRGYGITDISPLTGLTNLTKVHFGTSEYMRHGHNVIRINNISDLTPLAGLTNLTSLNLRKNNISDLTPLAGLTNLTKLDLSGNNITDLAPLSGLTNLTKLTLGDNNITDLSPLAGLTNLERLGLERNNISDLSPLSGLTNLTYLYLSLSESKNYLSQLEVLKEALPNLIIMEPYSEGQLTFDKEINLNLLAR